MNHLSYADSPRANNGHTGLVRPPVVDHKPQLLPGRKHHDDRSPRAASEKHLTLALPEPGLVLEQDAEWFLVHIDGKWRQIRFHDYAQIYEIPGLYERLFYDLLGCCSPEVVRQELEHQLIREGASTGALRVLDLGAGNGMVGEELRATGVREIVGVDITQAAAMAAWRDRPKVYDDYFVLDLASLTESQRRQLMAYRFNCLTCVAALGFGDIPPEAFVAALSLLEDGGWLAFNIKEEFVVDTDRSPFAALIMNMIQNGELAVRSKKRYCHRLSTNGQNLHYIAFAGRKSRSPA